MKNKKLELLRSKLAIFALATSLSVTNLSGCGSSKILSSEEIASCIENTYDFGNYAGLYKKQDGSWGIYYKKNDKYYDFKSYEYLNNRIFLTSIFQKDDSIIDFDLYKVGYLPFNKCNSNVKYTLNVLNNLTEPDIEKLKNDFFEKNGFGRNDIKLFHIEKIDGTNKQLIIGYPITDTEIFNIETWQPENYEGYAIVKESCKFNKYSVDLSEILDYLNEKRKNIEEVSTTETEIEYEEIQEEIETPSNANDITVLGETETEPSLEDEETIGYEIYSQMTMLSIYIKDNLTSENLTKEEEVLDFLANQKDKINTLIISNFTSDKNKANIEKILKEIPKNDQITTLALIGFENVNLSDILTMTQLKNLQLASCTLEDATQLNQFTQLEILSVDDVKDLNIISNLTQLQNLTIKNSGIELANIEMLKKFENLNSLNLTDCNLSDISVLYDLNHLTHLNLKGNPIQNLSELTNMKSKPTIYLDDNANVSDLKSCIEELTEKGINIYYDSNGESSLITKEYFEKQEELQLKLNK